MKSRPVHEFRSVFGGKHARRSRAKCRGAVAIELVLVAPAVVFLLLLGVAGGRLSGAQALVDDAAVSGARAASLAPGPAEALTCGPDRDRR